ncbi:MAG: heme-binding protein [Deltaproteobacteria bacterium]|nr:heme-binding protein [Deltaproteobacteria bacterium]
MSLLLSSCSTTLEVGTYKGYELPPYTVLKQFEQAELRQYAPQLVAEVTVEGERNEAINAGFRILAGYIFGANESADKVAMTTPVTQTPAAEKIAMTTPVTQAQVGQAWVVRFGMPKQYTVETLPIPTDTRIRFVLTPPSTRAVVRFSGFAGNATITEQTQRLDALITQQHLKRVGEPEIAFYDSPFTLPWNRRNEISAAVEEYESEVH